MRRAATRGDRLGLLGCGGDPIGRAGGGNAGAGYDRSWSASLLLKYELKITLAATDRQLADAWETAFRGVEAVNVHRGSIFEVACDALVSPANSFGFMDGGIDALYSERFGWQLQTRLRRLIYDKHHGELLVGNAEIVETGSAAPGYMIAAPTMRVPMVLDRHTVNPYLATRAVLLLVRDGSFSTGVFRGEPILGRVNSIAFPGMGTGVGRVPAAVCARQMRVAVDEVFSGTFRMPASWAEASERPVRLQ